MSEGRILFEVGFTREYEDREDTELRIGIYETEAEAKAVVEMLKFKTGFQDFPEGFWIEPIKVGLTGWTEGFVTKYGPPPKDANSGAFDLPAWIDEA